MLYLRELPNYVLPLPLNHDSDDLLQLRTGAVVEQSSPRILVTQNRNIYIASDSVICAASTTVAT